MNEPHLIVLFGATGDLARRKLLPGIMHLLESDLVPESRIIGVSLDEFDDERLPYVRREGVPRVHDPPAQRQAVGGVRRQAVVRQRQGRPRGAGRGRVSAGGRARWLAAPPALPQRPAQGCARRRAHARRRQPGRALADHHGEAVRHRPGQRQVAQLAAARGLRRGADLPHRPLPRQGGGAQHPGVPLRQRPVRADLEPQLHRPRADRRARDAVRRGPVGVLRGHRRVQGHGRDAPVPGPGVHGDGAADLARLGLDQRGEEQGLPPDAAARPAPRRTRAVPGLPRRGGRRRRLRDRHVRRAQGRDRQLALGRRAVLPAHGQEARRGSAHHLDRVPRAAQVDVPRRLGRRPRRARTT